MAAAALGDLPRLNTALAQGLDAGLTISETKEILVQLYAYAGFPRSLNALGELMKVLDARRQRGVQDAPGREPATPIPTGKELHALGTANQTKLVGGDRLVIAPRGGHVGSGGVLRQLAQELPGTSPPADGVDRLEPAG